jgi:predicted transcriptional regulator
MTIMQLSEGERKILRALVDAEIPLTSWHLVEKTKLSKNTVRSYLYVLLKAGLVRRPTRGIYGVSREGSKLLGAGKSG